VRTSGRMILAVDMDSAPRWLLHTSSFLNHHRCLSNSPVYGTFVFRMRFRGQNWYYFHLCFCSSLGAKDVHPLLPPLACGEGSEMHHTAWTAAPTVHLCRPRCLFVETLIIKLCFQVFLPSRRYPWGNGATKSALRAYQSFAGWTSTAYVVSPGGWPQVALLLDDREFLRYCWLRRLWEQRFWDDDGDEILWGQGVQRNAFMSLPRVFEWQAVHVEEWSPFAKSGSCRRNPQRWKRGQRTKKLFPGAFFATPLPWWQVAGLCPRSSA